MALQDALYLLDQMGFTDVFLPFILIFTIVFATLQKVKIFGEDSKKFNSIISLALAIGVVIPHSLGKYPPGADIVQILNTALPNVSLFIVAIVFLLVFIGLFGGEANWGGSGFWGGAVTLISVAVLAFIFGNAAGWWEASGALNVLSDPNIQAVLIIIIVFWMIISTITKEDNAPSALNDLGAFFGKQMADAAKKGGEKKQ